MFAILCNDTDDPTLAASNIVMDSIFIEKADGSCPFCGSGSSVKGEEDGQVEL